MATHQIAVRLPAPLLSSLDDLVDSGAYGSRAAVVRAGIEAIARLEQHRRIDQAIGRRLHAPAPYRGRGARRARLAERRDPRRAVVTVPQRGQVWWAEIEHISRRPFLVMTRSRCHSRADQRPRSTRNPHDQRHPYRIAAQPGRRHAHRLRRQLRQPQGRTESEPRRPHLHAPTGPPRRGVRCASGRSGLLD